MDSNTPNKPILIKPIQDFDIPTTPTHDAQTKSFLDYKMRSWSFVKRRFDTLYIVAICFITAAFILFLLPTFQNAVGQIIGGALLGAGLTIFVTKITAQQSIHEQYNKEANIDRKSKVYEPLHAQLRELREIFDEVHAGRQTYPVWIKIEGDNFQPSLYQGAYEPPKFFWWPSFKKNSDVDDSFSLSTQKLLDEVQGCISDAITNVV